MPYDRNADLPGSVRDALPKEAQTLYRKVFNHAWEEYAQRGKRRGGAFAGGDGFRATVTLDV